MSLEVVHTCPLGHECERADNGKIYRCRWFQQFRGEDPQTGEEHDKWDCAIPFGNIMAMEGNRWTRSNMNAVLDLRNHVASSNQKMQEALETRRESNALLSSS